MVINTAVKSYAQATKETRKVEIQEAVKATSSTVVTEIKSTLSETIKQEVHEAMADMMPRIIKEMIEEARAELEKAIKAMIPDMIKDIVKGTENLRTSRRATTLECRKISSGPMDKNKENKPEQGEPATKIAAKLPSPKSNAKSKPNRSK